MLRDYDQLKFLHAVCFLISSALVKWTETPSYSNHFHSFVFISECCHFNRKQKTMNDKVTINNTQLQTSPPPPATTTTTSGELDTMTSFPASAVDSISASSSSQIGKNPTKTDEDSQQSNTTTEMAFLRSTVQIFSLVSRRLSAKLMFTTIACTIVMYIIQEYFLPNPHLFRRFAELDRLYNGTYTQDLFNNPNTDTLELPPKEKRPPDSIICGVSKCGTRAMIEFMKIHPDVAAATPEIGYFNNDSLFAKGPSWYLQQMPLSREGQKTVEKSPDYFQNPDCAPRIHQFKPDIKLILLLRDPVERLISQYMQLFDKNPKLPVFEDWAVNPQTGLVNFNIPSVQVSAYSQHLDSWLRTFNRKQILIIESRSLRDDPFHEMKRVESFLQLKPYFDASDFYFNSTRGFFCLRYRSTGKTKCLGKSKGRQHIPVENRTIRILQEYYKPYNTRLNEMLGYSFPWS